ncbi:hypothetical protein A3C23_02835 [Candidatus Roizmanbacteria bacterium RIFCSPHIGHO2_02_FULL_37_13b]|uniref:Penicillin-binding protein transpeptidase domain-containing protein n=1 Tax=Candidatus Roizmanbacteria bacterium RIFCSPLOWO2_02_FULL_36_11 TaxID=1802071 RepID=A0A1F7JG61_9BACT|nr:MAG: hypothetical protein A3C23_02835 [Candidatus Roizmanbacteria bacterium RIFCSPHIGHO2_02_FULL_37_13b]OGK54609.1 MAG: hypothetical protein A3H78_01855 [Candidatus Roizmanbacteria bacterium RIFCSPLOWO2_02_FULL_36_11]
MTRLRIILAAYFLLLLAVIIKLFIIQVVFSDKYTGNIYLKTQKIQPFRGAIFDHSSRPLAFNEITYLLFAEPKKIIDKESIVKKIDSITQIGETTISAKLNTDKSWIAIGDGISQEQKKKIESEKIVGLGFEERQRVFYPESSLSAHIMGFVGKNDVGDNVGYFGIEGFYEKDLAGLPGIVKTERDLLGNPILVGVQNLLRGENGRDLILTLDKNVQYIVKKNLLAGLNRYKAKGGCAIVANPKTMEIIAMSCLPDYDPTNYQSSSEEIYKNPAVSSLYEPGSIWKPIIMASALNSESIKPTDVYNETGSINVGGYEIQTWDNKYEGEISMTRILEKSSNVGMVFIGSRLGNEKLIDYLDKFGVEKKTGIDLQGEISGILKPKSQWYDVDYATATFGQGLAVTPIRMITSFAALINGGNLMRPYVVSKMKGKITKTTQPAIVDRVISRRTSIVIKNMLQKTVENAEVKWKRPAGYKIGGKTGTAQVAIAGHYDPSKTIASFVGFTPVEDPQLIILVVYREPQTSPWGSETAAPVFFEILNELLLYYNIAPE